MGEVAEFALLYDIELTNDVVLFAGDTGLATTFVAGAVITSASVSTLPGFSNIAARFLTEKDILKAVYSQLEFSAKYIGFNAVRSVLELKGDDSFVKVTVL
jgi:molybdopterin biosynthesis enzyme MoaB